MSSDVAAKKKGKGGVKEAAPDTPPLADKANGDDGNESAYIKEIHKHIRNLNKKLNATQKVDSIIADNPNLSLDDLVNTRKINADQKQQALNKPGIQAKLVQLEDQLAQYKKFEEEYQSRWADERSELVTSHQAELDKVRKTARAEAVVEAEKTLRERLLVLSKFLRAAAARRQMDEEESDESKGFEGVLLLLYGGDRQAVDAAEKLIGGSSDAVPSTEGMPLDVNYERIKQLAVEYTPFAAEEAWVQDVAAADSLNSLEPVDEPFVDRTIGTDPTIAHATLTEIQAEQADVTNDMVSATPRAAKAEVDLGAANAAAANQWNNNTDLSASVGDDWVSVPRDPAETETPQFTSSQTWADEPPEALSTTRDLAAETPPNDGFHEVHHGRGRGRGGAGSFDRGNGRGRGSYRGDRGSRGGYRGRGGSEGYSRGGPSRGGGRGGRGRDGA